MLHHLKYLKYLLIHKWYVFWECWEIGIVWRGIIHDLSKFYPDEWIPYCTYFYKGKKNKEEFNKAWRKHYLRNKHHWNYWVDFDITAFNKVKVKPLEIPYTDLLELVADWNAMGKVFNNSSLDYYKENKDKILLHSKTRLILEDLLNYEE